MGELKGFHAGELDLAKWLTASMPDGAILFDAHLRPVEYNSSYVALVGLRRRLIEERLAAGCSAFELLGRPGGLDRVEAARTLANRDPVTLAEVQVFNAVGQPMTVFLTFLPFFDRAGQPAGIIEMIRDLTAEAAIQERYKDLLAAERQRADELEKKVEERTRDLSLALEQVTRLSQRDPLTGLLNRRAFTERAEQALALARRHGRAAGLLLCDLDYFKQINDEFGHQAGDALLIAVATGLLQLFRASDAVGRFGGEEFVVLLAETDAQAVQEIAARCRQMVSGIAMEQVIPGCRRCQTVSIGLALYPTHSDVLDGLIRKADRALYFAKESGRDRTFLFDEQAIARGPVLEFRTAARVLVVDSDRSRLDAYRRALGSTHEVTATSNPSLALAHCYREAFDVIVADESVAGTEDGAFLSKAASFCPGAMRVLIGGSGSACAAHDEPNCAHRVLSRDDVFSQFPPVIAAGLAHRARALDAQLGARKRPLVKEAEVADLECLLDGGALRFVYQPIVHANEHELFGYEALLRSQAGGLRDAGSIVEAAVQTGNIRRLGRLVRDIAPRPIGDLPEGATLFINIHPDELDDPLLGDPSVSYSGWAHRIVFEITEMAPLKDTDRLRRRLAELKARGYRLAIDDLGNGHAGLNSIALIEPDFIKLDMDIVHGIGGSPHKTALVRRMVQFANDAGIKVIAEGVETKEEATVVRQLGCHLLQGFYLGRPQPLESREPRQAALT